MQTQKDHQRRVLRRTHGNVCFFCGLSSQRPLTLDHFIPRSLGGPGGLYNKVLSCRACNQTKGATLIQDELMINNFHWYFLDHWERSRRVQVKNQGRVNPQHITSRAIHFAMMEKFYNF